MTDSTIIWYIRSRTSWSAAYFARARYFCRTCSICFFHSSFSSKIMPRILCWSTLCSPCPCSVLVGLGRTYVSGLNLVKCIMTVLEVAKQKHLVWAYWPTLSTVFWSFCGLVSISLPLIYTVQSSVYLTFFTRGRTSLLLCRPWRQEIDLHSKPLPEQLHFLVGTFRTLCPRSGLDIGYEA
jgi:hypothetical protein